MELVDYVRVVRQHWRGVLAIVVLAVAAAAAFTLSQPKVYAADASGFVTAGESSDPGLASVNDSLAKSRAASYVDIASSRAVADLVIDDLDLDQNAASLIGSITVEQPVDTVLIKISARSDSPLAAQRLADAWVSALSVRVDQLEDPDGGNAVGVLGVEPVEAAALPSSPVSPQPPRNLGLGLVLGLLLGVAYAVVRSLMDRRLRSPEQVERDFGVAIAGRIPATGRGDGERGIRVVDSHDEATWGFGEAFRKLRTNLSYMNVDQPPRVIVVTSPLPKDGKSTTAVNLAAAIALSGQAVTLVDADLRRPTVADTLGLVEGAGLTDVLIGRVEIDDVLQQHDTIPQLTLLAAGSVPPNPSELLGSQSMRTLLEALAQRGLVVVDAPPLLPVTDAAILTRHGDGALVVVSSGRTLDTDLQETLRQLEAVNGTVLGVVFNRMPQTGSYGSAYRAGYGSYRALEPSGRPGRRKADATS